MKVAPIKPTVSIDLLNQLDIRAGTIKRVQDVKGIGYADGLKPVLALPEAEVPNSTRVG